MFKRDEGLCNGMPCVDFSADPCTYMACTESLREMTGMAMIQTVGKQKEVTQAIAVSEAQE
jgi:hypothetical protein